jgi:hypothetical protein
MFEGTLVVDPGRSPDAVGHAILETRQTPFWEGNADDRHLQRASLGERVERRENHFVREIARYTEEHQCI